MQEPHSNQAGSVSTQDTVLTFRPLSLEEMTLALDWAAQEGWNPGLHDAAAFHAMDLKGFWVGERIEGQNREIISLISAVNYDAHFGFMGFYIVKPEYRKRGYGLATWKQAMMHLGPRNIGLDGVVAQQENYQKSGFKLAYRNIRHEMLSKGYLKADVMNLNSVSMVQIQQYDRRFFPAERAEFLAHWLQQPGSNARICLHEGAVSGYGLIRPARTGFKIGPLFANTQAVADELFRSLANQVVGHTVYLDTPESNPHAIALAQRYGMTPMFETARMYTQQPPDLDLKGIYGVTSFELG